MIPVISLLDDTEFNGLVELARSRLPSQARVWTDYNFSDPGMTLIDLAAFIADTQVYSLSRNRRDERIAMAGLLGVHPLGAEPATGTLYPPKSNDPNTRYRRIEVGTRLSPIRSSAPRLRVAETMDMLPLTVEAVVTESPAGTINHTAANERPRASFAPFGAPTNPDAALRITLRTIPDVKLPDQEELRLALGFTVEADSEPDDLLGRIKLSYRSAAGEERPLELVLDTTRDLQRNGVIIVILAKAHLEDSHHIILRPTGAGALLPRLVRVAVNALPVDQQVTAKITRPEFGNERAGQTLELGPSDLLDDQDRQDGAVWRLTEKCPPVVEVGKTTWKRRDPDTADPDAEVYALNEASSGARITLRFGNGINGRLLAPRDSLKVTLSLSRGGAGNVHPQLDWALENHGLNWINTTPIRGGRNPLEPEGMLDEARVRLRARRPLAISADIEDAVRKLPYAYAIARAEVEEGWEPGRHKPASPRTRTLVVSRRAIGGDATESPAWIRAIRRRIAPRLDLGERLIVVAPNYRKVRVEATIVVATGLKPETVAKAVKDDLLDRLRPVGERGKNWPLGRQVSAVAIGGWIHRVAGVARVKELKFLDATGKPIDKGVLKLKRGELPDLTDVKIDARTAEARS
ncbi:hypothetical protein [Bradyrhizobium sp. 2S1]|uniref:hypothetical protein n=1 Tax=Bradyrhizobium sp. 2S1 TaxID=1404429 RepID=UPI0014083A10|nr:hypothetical protein [Bradyrhizobium sp. 2S1]MCK7665032.1 hypothetical protein [Bradyrhizobium sp. 2S1]